MCMHAYTHYPCLPIASYFLPCIPLLLPFLSKHLRDVPSVRFGSLLQVCSTSLQGLFKTRYQCRRCGLCVCRKCSIEMDRCVLLGWYKCASIYGMCVCCKCSTEMERV